MNWNIINTPDFSLDGINVEEIDDEGIYVEEPEEIVVENKEEIDKTTYAEQIEVKQSQVKFSSESQKKRIRIAIAKRKK